MSRLSRAIRSCRGLGHDFARYRRTLGVAGALQFLRNRSLLRDGSSRNPWIQLTASHLRFPVFARPGSSDLEVFEQVLVEQQYQPPNEELAWEDGEIHDGLIIDCGANVGYASLYFLNRYPRATVIAIEPDPENARVLRANVAPYGARCRVVEAAVWSEPSELAWAPAFRDGREWSRQVRAAQVDEPAAVPAIDLGTVLRDSGFSRIALLKMDIEGAETQVLRSARIDWLARVERFFIELHDEEARAALALALSGHTFSLAERGEVTIGRRVS